MEIREISGLDTRRLRRIVLRPHQQEEELFFAGDDDEKSKHFAAYLDGEMMGIVSLYFQPQDWTPANAWQFRGMAILPEHQGKGLGKKLLDHAIRYAKEQGGEMIWCKARISALDFYHAMGFALRGEEFQVPEAGPHILMYRSIE